ncbi:MAG: PD-(D/E)XK nuclease family protein [Lentimicrobiaceae bacterium]|nr:PD-(D/E)XK nuclease family protein [Lentimicrobiaceae bacterium]
MFVQPFLLKTAEYLIDNYGNNISNLCVVFPNRRAGLFLQKYLGRKLKETIFLPSVFSSGDFMMKMADCRLVDPIALLFELYAVHCSIEKENASAFDDFMSWAQLMLNDFNEADMYMVQTTDLFGYLTEAKALKLWNPEGIALTEFEIRYLRLYNSLQTYYTSLAERLQQKNLAYEGLAYRRAAENMPLKVQTLPWEKVVFAGFNALTKAEEAIIEMLVDQKKGELLWDSDVYYTANPMQEAGKFIRDYRLKWNDHVFRWEENFLSALPKKIQLIGVPNTIGQTKIAGALLQNLPDLPEEVENTAVVLADESLLVPVLNSIPQNIKKCNVTMGFPLKLTSLYNLLDSIFTLHENTSIYTNKNKDNLFPQYGDKYYYRDVLKVLLHPYIRQIIEVMGREDVLFSAQPVLDENKVFFAAADVYKLFTKTHFKNLDILLPVFDPWNDNAGTALLNLQKIIDNLRVALKNSQSEDKAVSIENEFLFAFAKLIKRLKTLLENYGTLSVATLHKFFNQLSGTTSLPFYGEPLSGVQLMGMLETRNLDFKNIILLSANENTLPSGKTTHSFIPYDIRKEFGLPTYHDRNAIFAYHFYRLLQRAENIYLVYNTQSDELGGGEKSRFLQQLLQELPVKNPEVQIHETIVSQPLGSDTTNYSIQVAKNRFVSDRLLDMAKSGFSPSSLSAYITCSLRFFYQEVIRLGEPEKVDETIDAATFGKIVHASVGALLGNYTGKPLQTEFITREIPGVEDVVNRKFASIYKSNDIRLGKNLLMAKVVCQMIKKYLLYEKEEIEILGKKGIQVVINKFEQKLQSTISVNGLAVQLKGFADRVDTLNGKIRITDYKTGQVTPEELKINEIEQVFTDPGFSKALQLLMYAYLYHLQFSLENPPETGILSMRNLSKGFIKLKIHDEPELSKASLTVFEEYLNILLSEIFDTQVPFTQTKDINNCKYCNYKLICNR